MSHFTTPAAHKHQRQRQQPLQKRMIWRAAVAAGRSFQVSQGGALAAPAGCSPRREYSDACGHLCAPPLSHARLSLVSRLIIVALRVPLLNFFLSPPTSVSRSESGTYWYTAPAAPDLTPDHAHHLPLLHAHPAPPAPQHRSQQRLGRAEHVGRSVVGVGTGEARCWLRRGGGGDVGGVGGVGGDGGGGGGGMMMQFC